MVARGRTSRLLGRCSPPDFERGQGGAPGRGGGGDRLRRRGLQIAVGRGAGGEFPMNSIWVPTFSTSMPRSAGQLVPVEIAPVSTFFFLVAGLPLEGLEPVDPTGCRRVAWGLLARPLFE